MPNGLINLALGLAMQVGTPGPSEAPNFPAPARAHNQYGFEGSAEQRHPSDTQQAWVHGYFQEIPAYGGRAVYRPYNYKDVLSQSQTAAGWGERPAMPYSQQFWHKYHDQATMLKMSRSQAVPSPYFAAQQPVQQATPWVAHPSGFQVPSQQLPWQQTTPPASYNLITMPETLQAPPIQPASDFNQINYRK
jgi:hypothetical protein